MFKVDEMSILNKIYGLRQTVQYANECLHLCHFLKIKDPNLNRALERNKTMAIE